MRLKQCVAVNPRTVALFEMPPELGRLPPVQSCPPAVSIPPISLDDAPFQPHLRFGWLPVRLLAGRQRPRHRLAPAASLRSHPARPVLVPCAILSHPSSVFLTTWRLVAPAMFAQSGAALPWLVRPLKAKVPLRFDFHHRPSGWCHNPLDSMPPNHSRKSSNMRGASICSRPCIHRWCAARRCGLPCTFGQQAHVPFDDCYP